MCPSVPYFDTQGIERQRNLEVGYTFLPSLKLYLKKMKSLKKMPYGTK